jgi:GNAT superfamily N-acetyltransferase
VQQTQRLNRKLLSSAGDLLAAAFFTNPAHVYICPDPNLRYARLRWLLSANLRAQPGLEASFCLVEDGSVNAMGFWTHSDSPKAGLLRQVRSGLLLTPMKLGFLGIRRAFEVTEAIEVHLSQALGGQPHWYLNNMVVRDELQGRGIGTQLLMGELGIASCTNPDHAIALSTQKEENVAFYQRLGFAIAHSGVIGSGPAAFSNWVMVRGNAI